MPPIRLLAAVAIAVAATALLAACATPRPSPWEARLRGDAVVLLGEVHDNAALQRRRLAVLERAIDAGWRPAIVMEQFDRERQADIDRARRERPLDAQHVVDLAGAPGWDWALYRPVVDLALRRGLPLVAGDLSNADTTRIVRQGIAAVFDGAGIDRLGLDRRIEPAWQSAQEREIDAGHCHALPPDLWPRMARAQFARDAVLARAVTDHAGGGVVLLAGNGHVRRDFGVPRWLAIDPRRVLAVGFLEDGDESTPVAAFDAVVRAAPAEREDPCEAFRRRQPPAGPRPVLSAS
ncbi:MAG: ChaN family lipoprotein [Caldimonas sp.]